MSPPVKKVEACNDLVSYLKEYNAKEIHSQMVAVLGDNAPVRDTVVNGA